MKKEKKHEQPAPFERVTTGIAGLDTVTNGGFLKGGVYLMLGQPGTGKTILANQICFHHAKSPRASVLYVTLLAESHSRMMGNLRTLDFFNDTHVAKSVHYVSGYQALEKEGLKGLLPQIAGLIREKKATMLLVDGITTIGEIDQSPLAFRKFVHELNTFVASSGCTAFLLSSTESNHSHPEHTMVDGIVCMEFLKLGQRSVRQLEIRKFRGSAHLYGNHSFSIASDGIQVFPRTEAVAQQLVGDHPIQGKRLAFGVPGLDQMLEGGVGCQTATALLGASGTGKTILGMQFLETGAKAGEEGLYFGFYETPTELFEKSDQLNLGFRKWVEKNKIEVIWHPALEQDLDELGKNILDAVRGGNIKRVFLDGIDGLMHSSVFPNRILQFLTGLYRHLKSIGVTVLYTEETSLLAPDTRRQLAEFSAVNDNLLFIQHINIGSHLTRVLTVVKMRSSHYDHTSREFVIERGGAKILGPVVSPESLLTGETRLNAGKPQAKSKLRRRT